MSAPPYMKLYVADYLGDTHHLNVLEHGAYLLLLMAMWRAGGSLPASDLALSKLARCTPAQWEEAKGAVLPFFQRSRSKITHKRLAAEIAKYESISGKRSEAGKRGGSKKAHKNNGEGEAIAPDLPQQLPTYPEPEPEPEVTIVGGVGAGADDWPAGDLIATLVAQVESPWLDPTKSPGLVTSSGRLSAWKRDGASWLHDVVPVVTGLCRSVRQPISSWKFFDQAIARSIADNRQALTIPEARTHDRTGQNPRNDREARRGVWAEVLAEERGEGIGGLARAG